MMNFIKYFYGCRFSDPSFQGSTNHSTCRGWLTRRLEHEDVQHAEVDTIGNSLDFFREQSQRDQLKLHVSHTRRSLVDEISKNNEEDLLEAFQKKWAQYLIEMDLKYGEHAIDTALTATGLTR